MEEPAPLIKHSRKTNARARFLQVVFATEEKIIGGGRKGYTCMESLTQSTWSLYQAHWVLVEINKEQRSSCRAAALNHYPRNMQE